ncbi:MAG: LCP family protein [Parcubacteria group bacterium]|nr:LCP family protein [Parcubacteria group bacterium]
MNKVNVDLLKEKLPERPRRQKRTPVLFFGRGLVILLVIAATAGSVFSYHVTSTSDSSGGFPSISLFSTIKQLVSSDDRSLAGEEDDRVNFLLMGIGGEGHSGPQLTDTIIFTSYKPSDGSIGMMSLPRDMTVPIPGYGYRKVNHANAYGEMDEPGAGPALATQVIGDVLDEDIQYYLRVDFDGFAEFIDALNGIDVYVENTFTDQDYPSHGMEFDNCGYNDPVEDEVYADATTVVEIAEILDVPEEEKGILEEAMEEDNQPVVIDYSCRYESITFYEGWTHMDGDTALKFVRSRHGNNGEGSDFARSERQQKVILAVKDKVLSASTFLNPTRISKLMEAMKSNIATNLDVWEIVALAKELKHLTSESIVHHVIDASESSPLYATVLNGAYVLLPRNDDWSPLQNIAKNIFTPDEELSPQYADAPEDKPKFVRVEIQNGTNMTGLAFRTSQLLDGQGFDVTSIGNAASRNYEHTVIYDLTNGQRSEELKALRDFLKADVTLSATGWMISSDIVPKELAFSDEDYESLATQENLDFLIILGESASGLALLD